MEHSPIGEKGSTSKNAGLEENEYKTLCASHRAVVSSNFCEQARNAVGIRGNKRRICDSKEGYNRECQKKSTESTVPMGQLNCGLENQKTKWVLEGTKMRSIACEKSGKKERKRGRVKIFNGVGLGYTSSLEAYCRAHNSECYLGGVSGNHKRMSNRTYNDSNDHQP